MPRSLLLISTSLLLLTLATGVGAQEADLRWTLGLGPNGCNGVVFDVVTGDADELYVGGLFSECGGVAVHNVARFDPATGSWSALGTDGGDGVNARVRALEVLDGALYVGGEFTEANVGSGVAASRIARWDGAVWSALGSGAGDGVDNTVLTLEAAGGALYVGGTFDIANVGDPVAVNRIARWDGAAWTALGSGGGAGLSSNVFAIEEMGGDLFVGGAFQEANVGEPVPTQFLARWDGAAWSAVEPAGGINNSVSALAASGDQLYVGGVFTSVEMGGAPANHVAAWSDVDGWTRLGTDGGSGVSSSVQELVLFNGDLYALGSFTSANFGAASSTVAANRVARWDGATWSALAGGFDREPSAAAAVGGMLYFGGLFDQVDADLDVRSLATWDGSTWRPVPTGGVNPLLRGSLQSRVHAVAAGGDFIYFGGSFNGAGGVAASNLVRFQRSTGAFSAIGTGAGNGTNSTVRALLVDGDDLYVAGDFTEVNTGDPTAANRIARWDGAAWHTLGSGTGEGLGGQVGALATCGGALYAGGQFTEANVGEPVTTNRIARWDGAAWSPLGSGAGNGVSADVFALACDGDALYLGGAFVEANVGEPLTVNRVARWDGADWHTLGSDGGAGANGFVLALEAVDGELYAGGTFTTINFGANISAPYIARWDGDAWAPLGAGLNGFARALTTDGADLYVGGDFTAAGGAGASRLAHWTGAGWAPLGSGVDGAVRALALPGVDLLAAGGGFALAGGRPSSRIGLYATRAELAVTVLGAGSVISAPAGLDCPGTCAARFHIDTPVMLTASPDPGSIFEGWSGACTTGTDPCEIALTDDAAITASFAAAPTVDLQIDITDQRDPLPAGVAAVFAIEVTNLSSTTNATDVVVTAPLPPGLTLFATDGCSEDPAGAPTCSFGTIAAGASRTLTLEASPNAGAPDLVLVEACVSTSAFDPVTANDCDSEDTTLDLVAPTVDGIVAVAAAGDLRLDACQTVRDPVRGLRVQFSEAMADFGPGSSASVTRTGNYRLVRPATGADFSTADCQSPPGTDSDEPIHAVTWDPVGFVATLETGGAALSSGLFRLFVCAQVEDVSGNGLEGGLDVAGTFRVDAGNLLADGHFDRYDPVACSLDAWSSSDVTQVLLADPDAEDSPLSGSAGQATSSGFDLGQCVALQPNGLYLLEAKIRAAAGDTSAELFCELFPFGACTGTALVTLAQTFTLSDGAGSFETLTFEIETPPGTASGLCGVATTPVGGSDTFVDAVVLAEQPIFADGFESGDTVAWSTTVQ